MYSGLCMYHGLVWWNFNHLHSSQWINFSTQLCLFLCFFCTSLLQSFILKVIVSFLSAKCSLAVLLSLIYFSFDAVASSSSSTSSSYYYYYYNYHYYYSLQVSHISISWWSFTGVWMTASHFRFLKLFSVFWSITTSLDGLHSSFDFYFLQSFFQTFWKHFKHTSYNWYHSHPHVPQLFFSSLARSKYFSIFSLCESLEQQNLQDSKFSFFLLIITRSGLLVGIR